MYYYIVDPPQTKTDQQIISTIRNRLVPEGIAGEFIYRTPGQAASGLAAKALQQGFSTIVGIGNDNLASELAVALYDQPAALGIIPLHATSSLHELIGFSDWRIGIDALKNRKLALRDLGTINAEIGFLTDCFIRSKKLTEFHLHMARFAATMSASEIIVRLSSDTEPFNIPGVINYVIMPERRSRGVIGAIFSSAQTEIDTLLRSEQAVIQSRDEAVIEYGNQTIAHTPVTISIIPQAIRMVVARVKS